MGKIIGRYKKLKKLANLSLKTIDEFGFKYFITAALWEFKRKKLSIFESELESIKPEHSDSQIYRMWLLEHSITHDLILKMKNELLAFKVKPKITVVISIVRSDKQLLKKTLDSLNEQIYENFDVCLFSVQSETKQTSEMYNELSNSHIKNKLKLETHSPNEILLASSSDFLAFINAGTVLTSDALFKTVQQFNKNRDIDVIYCDEEHVSEKGERLPFFKPDWSPDLFLGFDYISNFYLVRTKLIQKAGGLRNEFGYILHYDLLLRLTEITEQIFHIPTIMISAYTPLEIPVTLKMIESRNKTALLEAISRRGIKGEVVNGTVRKTFRIKYFMNIEPKVSIIISTKDQKKLLERCLSSIERLTSYRNYEIIIIDNNSQEEETISYLKSLPYIVIEYALPFNFSKINNLAAKHASGDFLLFLNDDTAPLEKEWLTELVSIGNQENVGVVGPKLVFASNTVQHAGLALLKTGAGFHPFVGLDAKGEGYFGFLNTIRNCSAVTGACLLIKKKLFDEVGGFDEALDLYYQDADLCLKVIQKGYRVVYTPYAILLHQGSSTIKKDTKAFFAVENHYQFLKKWPRLKDGDPFYNPNLGWNYKIAI